MAALKAHNANDPRSKAGAIIYAAFTLVLALAITATFQLNAVSGAFEGIHYHPSFNHYVDCDQYALLADSLIEGHFDLDLPVAPEFLELEDPYNTQDRIALGSEDIPIFWDHAFFQGRYYCYFGVVPAILVYMPFKLVTGNHLPTPWAIGFIGWLAIIGASLLIRRIGLRYFESSVTTASLCACLLVMFQGANYVFLCFVARFYSVPIMSSLCATAFGLWFWMGASPDSKQRGKGLSSKLSLPHLAAGSACMALNLGCRPQFILASLLAFPIFSKEILSTRELFSKKGLASTVAAIVPFAVIFAPLLAYNYARFGSFFDFGSNYNLTGFNMTSTERQRLLLTAALYLSYLFAPILFRASFPFITGRYIEFPDLGWAPTEPFFGGFFLVKPIMLLIALTPLAWRELKGRRLATFVLLSLALAAIVLFVDVRIAGITERYFSDFGLYTALATCLIILCLQFKSKSAKPLARFAFWAFIGFALAFSMVIGCCELLSLDIYDSIGELNPDLYASILGFFNVG